MDLPTLPVRQVALAAAPEVGHNQVAVLVGRRGANLLECLARTYVEAFARERLVQQAAQRQIVLEQQNAAAQHDAGPMVTETLYANWHVACVDAPAMSIDQQVHTRHVS